MDQVHRSTEDQYNDDSPEAFYARFKIAANTVADLYQSGRKQRERAYKKGYEQCLNDLMDFINTHPSIQQQHEQESGNNVVLSMAELWNWAHAKHDQVLGGSLSQTTDELTSTREQPQYALHQQPQETPQQHQAHSQGAPTQTALFQLAAPEQQHHQPSSTHSQTVTSEFAVTQNSFEFSLPTNVLLPAQREIDRIDSGQDGGIGLLASPDLLKRKYGGVPEVNFFGRPMGLECALIDPPLKRNKLLRKDE